MMQDHLGHRRDRPRPAGLRCPGWSRRPRRSCSRRSSFRPASRRGSSSAVPSGRRPRSVSGCVSAIGGCPPLTTSRSTTVAMVLAPSRSCGSCSPCSMSTIRRPPTVVFRTTSRASSSTTSPDDARLAPLRMPAHRVEHPTGVGRAARWPAACPRWPRRGDRGQAARTRRARVRGPTMAASSSTMPTADRCASSFRAVATPPRVGSRRQWIVGPGGEHVRAPAGAGARYRSRRASPARGRRAPP